MIFKREVTLFYHFIQAVITLLVCFGLKLSPEQIGAILLVSSSGLALLTRSQVTPVNK